MTMRSTNKLICALQRNSPNLFFSLVDYRNNLFTSNDPKKIMEFYNGFENRDELIEWMRERPKGASYIHEVEGDKDIVVVIPTADFNGKYAKECRENIFKGFHIIFVESGGRDDFYFNYAHNCNLGIKKAMEYNPKWIVLSNDDMYKIDDVDVLARQLKTIDEKNYNAVFTKPSKYHSVPFRIIKNNFFYNLFQLMKNNYAGRTRVELYKKFEIRFIFMKSKYTLIFSFPRKGYYFTQAGDFLILSYEFVKQADGNIFDETYINVTEDVDLSFRISLKNEKVAIIDYKIGDYIGSTFGPTFGGRWFKEAAGTSYFNFKWEKELQKLVFRKPQSEPFL